MKRISTILLVLVLVLTIAMAAGCDADVSNGATGTATLIVEGDQLTTYTVSIDQLEEANGIALLEYLADNEGLHLATTDSEYGLYITEIGTLVAADDYSTWISLYTSIESDKDTSSYSTTLTVEGVTVYSSGLGISSMSISDGCTIYITLGSY